MLLTGPTITGVGYGTAEAIVQLNPKLLILAGRSPRQVSMSVLCGLRTADRTSLDCARPKQSSLKRCQEPN